jgi:DNA repair protein RadC
MAEGLALLDIKLHDSLIIGPQHGFYSFRDEGGIKS